jgi:hypothetical protein
MVLNKVSVDTYLLTCHHPATPTPPLSHPICHIIMPSLVHKSPLCRLFERGDALFVFDLVPWYLSCCVLLVHLIVCVIHIVIVHCYTTMYHVPTLVKTHCVCV